LNNPLLKVENVSTGYGKKQILFNVSFEVKEGDIVLLAGSNGSGKSTLLKAIYGILPLWKNPETNSCGFVKLKSDNISGKPTSKLLEMGLLYIPQKDNLFDDLTVKENLEMAGLNIDKKVLKERIEYSLSIFTGLVPHLNRIPMKLSGGEKRLLTLAMAILHQPKMILIDEPFAGLTPSNINFISENLKMLNGKSRITILIVEHRVKEGILLAKKVIGLKFGKVFSESKVNETFKFNELKLIFI
jgi:branched-chain amino acid transport system ATP-binding protein